MSKQILQVVCDGDLYEVALDGRLITRISKYFHGSQRCVVIHEWDELSDETQKAIETKAREALNESTS